MIRQDGIRLVAACGHVPCDIEVCELINIQAMAILGSPFPNGPIGCGEVGGRGVGPGGQGRA
jgi:hypothetical protein